MTLSSFLVLQGHNTTEEDANSDTTYATWKWLEGHIKAYLWIWQQLCTLQNTSESYMNHEIDQNSFLVYVSCFGQYSNVLENIFKMNFQVSKNSKWASNYFKMHLRVSNVLILFCFEFDACLFGIWWYVCSLQTHLLAHQRQICSLIKPHRSLSERERISG